jgi:hypothetical protein
VISPSQGRYLHRTTQTQNKRTQTSMPLAGFEPTIPVFKRPKTFHTSDRAATVTGLLVVYLPILSVTQYTASNLRWLINYQSGRMWMGAIVDYLMLLSQHSSYVLNKTPRNLRRVGVMTEILTKHPPDYGSKGLQLESTWSIDRVIINPLLVLHDILWNYITSAERIAHTRIWYELPEVLGYH